MYLISICFFVFFVLFVLITVVNSVNWYECEPFAALFELDNNPDSKILFSIPVAALYPNGEKLLHYLDVYESDCLTDTNIIDSESNSKGSEVHSHYNNEQQNDITLDKTETNSNKFIKSNTNSKSSGNQEIHYTDDELQFLIMTNKTIGNNSSNSSNSNNNNSNGNSNTIVKTTRISNRLLSFCVDHQILRYYCAIIEEKLLYNLNNVNLSSCYSSELYNSHIYFEQLFNYYDHEENKLTKEELEYKAQLKQYANQNNVTCNDYTMLSAPGLSTPISISSIESSLETIPFKFFVVYHDDNSQQRIFDKLKMSSESYLRSLETMEHVVDINEDTIVIEQEKYFSNNMKVIATVFVESTEFFEYSIYKNGLLDIKNQWENLHYVGITSYKTLESTELCGFEIERLINVGIEHNYDVIPLIRSKVDLLLGSTKSHTRGFKVAWDSLLSALGYDQDTIRKSYLIKPFFRNSMLIRPSLLKLLLPLMDRAIEIASTNETVRGYLSVNANYYTGDPNVARKIFKSNHYQLFPFVFERLPAFFLLQIGAKICYGNSDCMYHIAV